MTGVPPHQRNVAMVMQKPALMPGKSVRENLLFGNSLRRSFWHRPGPATRAHEQEAINQVASLFELGDFLDHRPRELSAGQLQRVALVRTLMGSPQVRLLDEPLGHLDVPMRRQLRRELHLLYRRFPATMIYVTHDPEEALAVGERIAVLEDGRLQQLDRPQDILSRPRNRFVAEFFQTTSGPMSFLQGLIGREGDLYYFQGTQGQLSLPIRKQETWQKNLGRNLILGLRSQDFSIQWLSPESSSWKMRVGLVETCDRGKLLTLEGIREKVTVFLARGEEKEPAVADLVHVDFRLERALFFDGVTGLNLESPG